MRESVSNRQQPDKREMDVRRSPVLRGTNLTLSDEPKGVLVNSSTSRQTDHGSLLRTDLETKKELPPPAKNEEIDSVSEFPRENIVLGPCLSNGTFGKVIQAQAYGILQPGVMTTVAVRMPNGTAVFKISLTNNSYGRYLLMQYFCRRRFGW